MDLYQTKQNCTSFVKDFLTLITHHLTPFLALIFDFLGDMMQQWIATPGCPVIYMPLHIFITY